MSRALKYSSFIIKLQFRRCFYIHFMVGWLSSNINIWRL